MYSLVISDKNDGHEIQNDTELGTHNTNVVHKGFSHFGLEITTASRIILLFWFLHAGRETFAARQKATQ